jgi:hypothetical protein
MNAAVADIALYCKSYRRDVLRVRRLLDSIERHNRDRLPVFVSMPQADRALFAERLGSTRCTLVNDEEIVRASPGGSRERVAAMEGELSQAIVKAEFWRLGLSESALCIDADSKFVADFGRADLLAPDGMPYTVIHQNKDLLQLASNRNVPKVAVEFRAEVERFRPLFHRVGPVYSFAPSPFLWSRRVWQSLERELLQPQGKTLWDVVTRDLPESLWYGEALLAYQAIPLRPIEPLFRVYHYNWQWYAMQRLGESEKTVAENYFGVIYQSNWEYEMDFGAPHKPLASRFVRSMKRGLRYLQNRWS